jgi:type III secretion protein J
MNRKAAVGVWVVALLVLGCDARIQRGLDEKQANEIESVLTERGFEARKVVEPGKKPTFAIEVDDEQSADAIRVLAELGLPHQRADGFGEVFGKGSLVPTPTEERALYVEALSGEVARTLESVEGVLSARVHLVLPPPARPGTPLVGGKASAFLRVRPGQLDRLGQQRAELRALIAGSVEGLSPDSVTLVVNEVSSQVPPPAKSASPAQRLRALVMVMGTALSILAIVLVLLAFRLRRYRIERAKPHAPPAPARPVLGAPASKRAA